MSLKRRIDRREGRVVVFGVGPYVLEIFQAMNLVRTLDIVENLRSALTKLGRAGDCVRRSSFVIVEGVTASPTTWPSCLLAATGRTRTPGPSLARV